MCPETEKGNYGVVLSSCSIANKESAVGALTKAFKFDAKTSNTVLERAPMLVFEGLTEAVGKLVLEKMKGLSDAGCELKLVAAPFETKRKLSWPKPHTFVRCALEEAAKAPAEVQGEIITCPKCGEKFTFDPASPAAQAAPPAKEPVEEIEELEEAIQAKPAELPAKVSDDIMDLDEFESSLGEIDLESPSAGTGGKEELDELAGAQPMESDDTVDEEKKVPDAPKQTPTEVQEVVHSAKPKPKAAAPAASDGGQGAYRVILSKMRSDKVRNEAAEIIAQVRGISQEEALKAAGKLIVTAVKDVTEEKANEIKNTFTEKGIKAIVSKRK